MRKAKKLALLLLSLVLLIGTFTVLTMAEETATATVVYPDGTTAEVAVGESLLNDSFKTEGEAKLYYGAENTLYKATGESWIFTYTVGEGENAETKTIGEDLIVPEDAAGATITAGGADKVYYTHIKGGTEMEFNTDSVNYKSNFVSLLAYLDIGGSDIKMYADITLSGAATVRGAHGGVKNYIDLNGHRLTIGGATANFALDVATPHLAIYSSVPGGVWDCSSHTTLFRSNDDATKYDTEYNKQHPDAPITCNAGTKEEKKHAGCLVIGERAVSGASTVKQYGDNITLFSKGVMAYPYGNNGSNAILGGTFVQSGASTNFVYLQRGSIIVRNATFVITDVATVPVMPSATKSFTDCTFVYAGENCISLTNGTTAATFTNCNFINITPSYSAKHTYQNCSYGVTGLYPTMDLNPAEDAENYLAHGTKKTTVTVRGKTYELNGVVISSASEALLLDVEYIGKEYWAIGSTPDYVADPQIQKFENGKVHHEPSYDYAALGDFLSAERTVIKGGESALLIAYAKQSDPAFSYRVNGGELRYGPSQGDTDLDGATFVATLGHLSNLEIQMFVDIVLHEGVLFGTADIKTLGGKPYHKITSSGDVDWDLNGHTVTMAEGAEPLYMGMYEDSGSHVYSCLHMLKYKTFKLYSSVEGGKYINNSGIAMFGLHKYSAEIGSYLLGTNNASIDGGNNLTITTNAPITRAYETRDNGPAGYVLTVNGGTYEYSGTGAVFNLGRTANIKNATIKTTNAALAVVINYWYANNAITTFDNCEILASNTKTTLIDSGAYNVIYKDSGNTSKPQTVTIKDTTFIGGKLQEKTSNNLFTYTYAGHIVTDTLDNLAIAYIHREIPAGEIAAYAGKDVCGTLCKTYAYYPESDVLTVENPMRGTSELWLAGSTYIADEILDADCVVEIEGTLYFLANSAWVGKIGDTVVENICDKNNAGKTVVLSVNGNAELVYFTRKVNDVITYYHGEKATAETAFLALLNNLGSTSSEITLHSHLAIHASTKQTVKNGGKEHFIDLNGYTLTADIPYDSGYAFLFQNGTTYIYSSVFGGVLDCSASREVLCADTSGSAVFGEKSKSAVEYGDNFTLKCQTFNFSDMWGNGYHILGGTYIQESSKTYSYMFNNKELVPQTMRNATFILTNVKNVFRGMRIPAGVSNCNFICTNPTTLFTYSNVKNSNTTFTNCSFYNVDMNTYEEITITYTDCIFGQDSSIPQAGGYIAYTGNPVTKTINGVDYVFGAQLVEKAGLVDWGFGLGSEYWAIGATATRDIEVIDEIFAYEFAEIPVTADKHKATATLVAIYPGALQMSLTLHSYIGLNLIIKSGMCSLTDVKVGDQVLAQSVDEANGTIKVSFAVSPTEADENVVFTIVVNGNEHDIPVGVGAYAKAVLGNEAYANAHDMTYAMVEYVRAMNPDAGFLDGVELEGYKAKEMPASGVASGASGCQIAFCLDDTIAIAVSGAGESIVLKLPSGRVLENPKTVGNAKIFDELAVNELAATFEVVIDGTGYEYSLVDYYCAMEENADKTVVKALYSYSQYAFEYAKGIN